MANHASYRPDGTELDSSRFLMESGATKLVADMNFAKGQDIVINYMGSSMGLVGAHLFLGRYGFVPHDDAIRILPFHLSFDLRRSQMLTAFFPRVAASMLLQQHPTAAVDDNDVFSMQIKAFAGMTREEALDTLAPWLMFQRICQLGPSETIPLGQGLIKLQMGLAVSALNEARAAADVLKLFDLRFGSEDFEESARRDAQAASDMNEQAATPGLTLQKAHKLRLRALAKQLHVHGKAKLVSLQRHIREYAASTRLELAKTELVWSPGNERCSDFDKGQEPFVGQNPDVKNTPHYRAMIEYFNKHIV